MLPEFKFHHIGVAVKDINKAAKLYIDGGYDCSEVIYDPIQNVKICFLTKAEMPMVELLAPNDEKSPINNILQKVGSGPYHCCYIVDSIDDAIVKLKKLRFIPTSKPAEAVAIHNHRVCFLYNREIGLIELVE